MELRQYNNCGKCGTNGNMLRPGQRTCPNCEGKPGRYLYCTVCQGPIDGGQESTCWVHEECLAHAQHRV